MNATQKGLVKTVGKRWSLTTKKQALEWIYADWKNDNLLAGAETNCGLPAVQEDFVNYAREEGIQLDIKTVFETMLQLER